YDATGPGGQSGIVHSGPPKLPVNGPWLDGADHHKADTPWMTYAKASDVTTPGPAMLWVLVDEDARGLNDAAFAFEMESPGGGTSSPSWIDAPGTDHNGGCGLAYADGHSETHHWLSPSPKVFQPWTRITDPRDLKDWQWMRQRTSARAP